jgi:hypothetical protein
MPHSNESHISHNLRFQQTFQHKTINMKLQIAFLSLLLGSAASQQALRGQERSTAINSARMLAMGEGGKKSTAAASGMGGMGGAVRSFCACDGQHPNHTYCC